MTNNNIFRQAKRLLDTKRGDEMTEEELQLINTAIIPLMIRTNGLFDGDSTIAEGLKELARIVDGKKNMSRGRVCGQLIGLISRAWRFNSSPR